MSVQYLAGYLLIGLIAGWLASFLMRGRGFGMLGDIIVGMLGAILGGWLFTAVGLTAYGATGTFLTALVGAVVLLGFVGVVKHA